VQSICLQETDDYWHILGRNAWLLQGHGFESLQEVEVVSLGFSEPEDQNDFRLFIDEKASDAKLRASLKWLSSFLTKKAGRQVIVLIDEYEAPNNYAYEYGFYKEVRPLRPPRLYSRLTTLIQADESFGHSVLPALLKVAKIYLILQRNI